MKNILICFFIWGVAGTDPSGRGLLNGIGGLNKLVTDEISPAESFAVKKIGATVATGMAITSTINRAIADGKKLENKATALTRGIRSIRSHAVRVVATPSAANKRALIAALKALDDSQKLEQIRLSGSEIIGFAKQAYHLVGEMLNQMNFNADDLLLLDQDLLKITQGSEDINVAGNNVNEQLKSLLEEATSASESNITPTSAQMLLVVNEGLEQSLEKFKEVLSKGLTQSRKRVSTFINDIKTEVGELEGSVEKISNDIRQGISAVLLGQIEADTKSARECYRRLYEKFGERVAGQKSNYELLIAPEESLSRSEKNSVENLEAYLQHFDTGIKSCIEQFRGLYDPARGPPTRPRGLFSKVLERFQFEFAQRNEWTGAKARKELKKFPLMATQLLIQLTNLFIFDASLSAKIQPSETQEQIIFTKQSKTMMGYLKNTKLVIKKFTEVFPHCPLSHPLREGVLTHRIYCDQKFLPLGTKEEIPANQEYGVPLGTVCSFECYDQVTVEEFICGPEGKWSLNETEIVSNLLGCINSLGGGGHYAMSTNIGSLSDCADIKISNPMAKSGVYTVQLHTTQCSARTPCTAQVYCDMETDGGGWTVLQKRFDGSVDFERNWDEYEEGFGNLEGEHWMGLRSMKTIASKKKNQLLIEISEEGRDCNLYSLYDSFSLTHNPANKEFYKLNLGPFIAGTAGDGLNSGKGMSFSTRDRDRDSHSSSHCAKRYRSGWWHDSCFYVNLNGLYRPGDISNEPAFGIIHYYASSKKYNYSYASSQMKIRPHNFSDKRCSK